jgi:hypothetical protein
MPKVSDEPGYANSIEFILLATRPSPPPSQTLSSSIKTRNIGIRATLHLHSNLASLPSIENQSLYKYTTNALGSVLIEALLETGNCSGCCRSRRRGR